MSALREAIIATARAMNAAGINRGTAGNVSARIHDGFLITPSGVPYDLTTPDDIVAVNDDGQPRGRLAPSSEWRFHREIYRDRPELHAIVHTHSPFATALACLDRGIPAFHYMVAVAGVYIDLRSDIWIAFAELHERAQHFRRPILLDLSVRNRLQPIAAEDFNVEARCDKAVPKGLGIEYASMAMVKVEVVQRILRR